MKLSRSYLFIVISSIALIAVLAIQVSWLFKTARAKADLFNEKAGMVLSKTVDELNLDKAASVAIGQCGSRNEIEAIDSMLSDNMRFYNFYLDYEFEIIPPGTIAQATDATAENNYVYTKRLNELANEDGAQLKLIIPGKSEFVRAEMGPLFFTSVILIVVVLILYWRTVLSLIRQQKIAQYNTDFLNNMTHELKTPLTNIGLAGRMILKDGNIREEEKIRHYSSIILGENEKLKTQVDQVLSMGALERGEIPLNLRQVDFHELIHDCLDFIQVQIENCRGEVSLNLAAKCAVLQGDRAHLANTVTNLIDNAIKYSQDKPAIAIRTFNEEQQLKIEITDNGMGIDKKFHARIFEQFFRVPNGNLHRAKGFGMGLAYTKTVIELHGGSISLASEKGNGTTFTISLPHA